MAMRRRGLLGLIATGLAAVLVPGKHAEVDAAPASAAVQGLEGTWVTTFTATGGAGGPQRVHTTFTADGTVIVTTSVFPRTSPAQGVWEQTGEREFVQTHVHLRYDEQDTWVGLTKVRLTITLNEMLDEYTGVGIAEDIDLDGNVVATRRPSATYHRMRVEPPA